MNHTSGEKAALKGMLQWYRELTNKAREVRGIIIGLGGSVEDDAPEPSLDEPEESVASNLGPQQVVEKYLRDHKLLRYRPRDLARRIVADGYAPTNLDVWPNQVFNCVKRGVAKGLIEVGENEGKTYYGWKRDGEGDSDGGNQSPSES